MLSFRKLDKYLNFKGLNADEKGALGGDNLAVLLPGMEDIRADFSEVRVARSQEGKALCITHRQTRNEAKEKKSEPVRKFESESRVCPKLRQGMSLGYVRSSYYI